MSTNFDAGAFVINKDAGSQTADVTTVLSVAPCDLDIAGFAVYQTAATTTPSTFNIKVTPPVAPAIYARTYNYNYATAKNVAISSIATDGSALTFTVSGSAVLAVGDVISVTGSTLPGWNLKDAPIASVSNTNGLTTSFTVKYPEAAAKLSHLSGVTSIASGNSVAQVVLSTNTVTFTTDFPHGLKTGDKVTVTGVGGVAAANVTNSAVTVLSATSFSVTVTGVSGTVTAAAVTIKATVVSNPANPIVVTKGQVVNAVQLVNDLDVNRDADYTLSTTPYYVFPSDQVLQAGAKGAQFGAANLGNNAEPRLAGKIPAGSKVEVEMLVASATVAGLTYSVEFKKK